MGWIAPFSALPGICKTPFFFLSFFLSFFLYILPGARFRALSADVHCTLRVAG